MEYKIGEILTLEDDRVVEVVEVNHCFCDGCIFQSDMGCYEKSRKGGCTGRNRIDGKNIIYKEVTYGNRT